MWKTLLEALAQAPADRAFISVSDGEGDRDTLTFGAFRGRAAAIGAVLRGRGVRPGDTVILIMRQGFDLMAAFAGVMMIGGIPTILAYPHRKVEPAKYRAGLTGVATNLKRAIVVLDRDFPPDLEAELRRSGTTQVVSGLAARAGERPWEIDACDPNGIAFIQHSAGTTGLQKAVALSHAAVLTQVGHLAAALGAGLPSLGVLEIVSRL